MDKKNTPPDDYISLESFKKIFLHLVRVGFSFFGYLKRLVRKDLLFFIFIPLVGVILGFLSYVLRPVIYEQSMIITYNTLTKRTYYEMFAQLNNLTKSRTHSGLAKELGLTEKTVTYIRRIELKSLNGEKLENDTSSIFGQTLTLSIETTNNEISDSLEKGIINFINYNSYLIKLKEEQKQLNVDKIEYIDKELRKLDSLKLEYTRSLNTAKFSPTFYNNAFNPAEIYIHSFHLVNEKETALKWLSEESQPIYLVEGFKPSPEPKSISQIASILIGFAAGIALSFIVAILSDLRSMTNR